MTQCNRNKAKSKPSKPSPDFPLFAHPNGQWAKKISGKTVYFGPWDDSRTALTRYCRSIGLPPAEVGNAVTPPPCKGTISSVRSAGKRVKPSKPYRGFPLTAHPNGQWTKRIRGKLVYFGPWGDAQGALSRYVAQRADLEAGRAPVQAVDALTVRELLNKFLVAKSLLVESGQRKPRTFQDYKKSCDRIARVFGLDRNIEGLHPEDFERMYADITRTRGLVATGNEVQRIRSIFLYASKNKLIPTEVCFGTVFTHPARAEIRKHKSKHPPRLFEAREILDLLAVANPQMKAMILLGINCGFGNNDCATLPIEAVDLRGGWIDFRRPKTGCGRHSPLWPVTVDAIDTWLERRPEPRDPSDDHLLFISKRKTGWAKENANPISQAFGRLVDQVLGGSKRKKGVRRQVAKRSLGFYTLRHTFATVGGGAKDRHAVQCLMGHVVDDMLGHYEEAIDESRLTAVVNHIRAWLFGTPQANSTASGTADSSA
jgi:integrase